MINPEKVDIQIKDMSNKQLLDIANSIHKQGVAVFYNQDMNETDYIRTMKKTAVKQLNGILPMKKQKWL